jgi:hypothetical protein
MDLINKNINIYYKKRPIERILDIIIDSIQKLQLKIKEEENINKIYILNNINYFKKFYTRLEVLFIKEEDLKNE